MKYPSARFRTLGVGVAALVALLLLFLFNPETVKFYPRCPSLLLTGYQCPGCGTLRALHALLHGRLLQAWHYNPALIVGLPIVFFILTMGFLRRSHSWAERVYRWCNSPLVVSILLLAIITWTITRNF